MKRAYFIAGAALVLAHGAGAEGLTEGWKTDLSGEMVLVLSSMEDVGDLPASTGLGDVTLRLKTEKVLQNGAEIGVRFEARAQQDNAARAGFTGRIAPTGYGSDPLATLPPEARGAFTGLTRGGPVEDTSLIAGVETAQVYIDGGFGEVSAGLGRGVAARFHEGAPDIFGRAKAANPGLDPAGINIVKTRDDLTGPSAKITYQTPRLLGVRAGVSYTPEINLRGVDRDPARSVPSVVTPDLKNGVEVAVQASRKLTEQDVRLRASATYSYAEVSGAPARQTFEDVKTWSVGAEAEWKRVSIGADYLSSNNGFSGSGDYSAWSVGATTTLGEWDFGARYGESEDDDVQAKGKNFSIGATREFTKQLSGTLGYQSNELELGLLPSNSPTLPSQLEADGVVMEITLSF